MDISISPIGRHEDFPWPLLLDADPSRKMIERYLQRQYTFMARLGNGVVGVCVLYPVAACVIEIKNIAVAGEHQGKGIGKVMLRYATQWARNNGYKKVLIGTGNSSIGQLYLYQKCGFEMSELRANFFTDNYEEQLYENGIRVKHMIMLELNL